MFDRLRAWLRERYRDHPDRITTNHGRVTTVDVSERALREHEELCWSECPQDLRNQMVHACTLLPPETIEHVKRLMTEPRWPIVDELSQEERDRLVAEFGYALPSPFHFGTGMAIRNFLRAKGVKDEQTPSGNLDDYYVKALEAAFRA
jgi:hypothetical protein